MFSRTHFIYVCLLLFCSIYHVCSQTYNLNNITLPTFPSISSVPINQTKVASYCASFTNCTSCGNAGKYIQVNEYGIPIVSDNIPSESMYNSNVSPCVWCLGNDFESINWYDSTQAALIPNGTVEQNYIKSGQYASGGRCVDFFTAAKAPANYSIVTDTVTGRVYTLSCTVRHLAYTPAQCPVNRPPPITYNTQMAMMIAIGVIIPLLVFPFMWKCINADLATRPYRSMPVDNPKYLAYQAKLMNIPNSAEDERIIAALEKDLQMLQIPTIDNIEEVLAYEKKKKEEKLSQQQRVLNESVTPVSGGTILVAPASSAMSNIMPLRSEVDEELQEEEGEEGFPLSEFSLYLEVKKRTADFTSAKAVAARAAVELKLSEAQSIAFEKRKTQLPSDAEAFPQIIYRREILWNKVFYQLLVYISFALMIVGPWMIAKRSQYENTGGEKLANTIGVWFTIVGCAGVLFSFYTWLMFQH